MKNKKVLLSVLGAVALVAVFWAVQYGNVGTQGYLKFDNLNSFQKQAYWKMMKEECTPLLKAKGGSVQYRTCALNVMKKASEMAPTSCVDSDGGAVYTISGTVKSDLYPSGLTDYLYTFSGGKTYLMEGACSDKNEYMYYQKNCKEINKYYGFNDKDYSKVDTDTFAPDGAVCFNFVKIATFVEMLKDNWADGYSQFVNYKFDPNDKGQYLELGLLNSNYINNTNSGASLSRYVISGVLAYMTNTDMNTYMNAHNFTANNWNERVTVEEMLDLIKEAASK